MSISQAMLDQLDELVERKVARAIAVHGITRCECESCSRWHAKQLERERVRQARARVDHFMTSVASQRNEFVLTWPPAHIVEIAATITNEDRVDVVRGLGAQARKAFLDALREISPLAAAYVCFALAPAEPMLRIRKSSGETFILSAREWTQRLEADRDLADHVAMGMIVATPVDDETSRRISFEAYRDCDGTTQRPPLPPLPPVPPQSPP